MPEVVARFSLFGQVAMIGLLIAPLFCQKGPTVWREPDAALRSRVTDLAFPGASAKGGRPEAVLTLRFAPSFSPEFEIVVTIQRNRTVLTEYSFARVSSEEVYRRLSDSHRTPEAVVRLMDVKHVPVPLPAHVVQDWFQKVWTTLEKTSRELEQSALDRKVHVDGTQYSCAYQEGTTRLSVQLWGSEIGHESVDDVALVKWMNQIRSVVQDHAATGAQPGR
jgi:hypothetical protein